jgi:hypothetical protein
MQLVNAKAALVRDVVLIGNVRDVKLKQFRNVFAIVVKEGIDAGNTTEDILMQLENVFCSVLTEVKLVGSVIDSNL